MKVLHIPYEINEQYVLIWKRDEALFLMLPWLFWILLQSFLGFLLSIMATIIIAGILKQFTLNKPSGYMIHWVRYNIPKQYIAASFSGDYNLKDKQSLLFRGGAFPPAYLRHIAG